MTINFELLANWIPIILFFITILGGFWKIAGGLTKSIDSLNFEITRLRDSITESKTDRLKIHGRIDSSNQKMENHETRITRLEEWQRHTERG